MGRQMASLTSMLEKSANQMMTNAQPVMSALVTIKKVPPKVPRHAKPSQNQRRMASLTSMLEKSATQMTTNAQPVMSALVTRNHSPPMVPRHAKPSQSQKNLTE